MKAKWISMAFGVVLAIGFAALAMAETPVENSAGVDFECLAHKLVTQCAGVQEGDLVQISGSVRDAELLENLAVHARKVEAFPLVTLRSDRMERRMYEDIPKEFDSQTSEFGVKLATMITARIFVDFSESEGALAGVPAERIAAKSHANAPSWDLMLRRKVRQVYVGNDLYPTEERARLFSVPQEKLAKIFWDGVNVDYAELQATGEAVRAALINGKELQITTPGGTDLKMHIEGRPIFVSDGVISEEDLNLGNPGCLVWLPAGEVYITPIPGTAEGKVVIDRQFFQGKEIHGLTLQFKDGKLTTMAADSGLAPLEEYYGAIGAGKDVFSVVDLGINPNVRVVPDSRMVAWMSAGTITVGIGDNTWAGGENNSPFEFYTHLQGGTLKVDGEVLVKDGILKP